MTHQTCLAPHRDNPPPALGNLRLCAGHHATLTEALTGPSAAQDPTIDCAWGVRTWWGVTGYTDRAAADRALIEAKQKYRRAIAHSETKRQWRRPPALLAGDGTGGWTEPQNYRPGGLTRDYTALTLRLLGQNTGEKIPCVVHGAEIPLPTSEPVAELRSQIRHDLAYWIGRHVEDGARTPPTFGAEPATLVVWLAIQRDWAAAQDWAGDYVAVLSELRAKARRLIDLPRAPRVDVGTCPEYGCGGQLRSEIREEYDPRPSLVKCDACGHEWDSTQWMRLGVRLLGANGRTAA